MTGGNEFQNLPRLRVSASLSPCISINTSVEHLAGMRKDIVSLPTARKYAVDVVKILLIEKIHFNLRK